jgi:CRP/FNR family cyclic AMP-dependent transcriptional regulator
MSTSPDEEARFLSKVDVLAALTQEELDGLARSLPDRHLEAGEYLYRPRDRADGLFALKWGRIRIYKTDNKGGEFTLEVLGEGTVFGELALGPGRLRPTYARAVEPSLVAALRREDLEDLIWRNPEVGIRLTRLLSERLRLAQNRLAEFASKDVRARLASLLLYLADGEGVVTGANRYKIPTRYTHERLGTMIGAGRVTVSKAFASLRDAGAVEQRDRLVYITDLEALERAAESG